MARTAAMAVRPRKPAPVKVLSPMERRKANRARAVGGFLAFAMLATLAVPMMSVFG